MASAAARGAGGYASAVAAAHHVYSQASRFGASGLDELSDFDASALLKDGARAGAARRSVRTHARLTCVIRTG
jgi:hypothetical protein